MAVNEGRKGYKKTEFAWIPEEWEIKSLLLFADSDKNSFDNGPFGSNLLTSEIKQEGVPVIYVKDIKDGRYQWISNAYITEKKAEELATCNVRYGDVIITKIGDPPCQAALYNCKEDAIITQDVIRIRPNKMSDGYFLVCLLNSFIGKNSVKRISIIGTRLRVSLTDFKKMKLPAPLYSEQKKIAEILGTWDKAIELTEKLIQAKTQLKKGLMQQLLTGKRRFGEFVKQDGFKKTKLGLVPKDWEIKELGMIGTFSKGKGLSKSELIETGIPSIRYGEIYTTHHYVIKKFYSFISPESARESKRIQQNDILFAGSGETLEDIGKCVAFTDEVKAYAGGDVIILRPKNIDSIFLAYSLNAGYTIRQKYRIGQGHSVVHIYSKDLKQLLIFTPSLPEQKKIAAVLSACDKEIDLLTQKRDALKTQKKGLMQKLLTGQVRVNQMI